MGTIGSWVYTKTIHTRVTHEYEIVQEIPEGFSQLSPQCRRERVTPPARTTENTPSSAQLQASGGSSHFSEISSVHAESS